jgi:hypothetical protein
MDGPAKMQKPPDGHGLSYQCTAGWTSQSLTASLAMHAGFAATMVHGARSPLLVPWAFGSERNPCSTVTDNRWF